MKNWLLLVCLCSLAWGLHAQDQTLFRNTYRKGFYLGPTLEFAGNSQLASTSAGANIGLVLDDFNFGIYAMAGSDTDDLFYEDNLDRLELAQAGLELNYHYRPDKLIHPFIGVRAGYGGVNIDLEDDSFDANSIDEVWVFSPQLGLELNVASFFHVAAYGSYRYVDGVNNYQNFSDDDLRGFTGGVSLKFGWFGRNRNRDFRNRN
jgi:hypothetical protein